MDPQSPREVYLMSDGMNEAALLYHEHALPCATADDPTLRAWVTKDSGQREEFATGSRRDTRKGKGRFDLISVHAERREAELLERGAEKYGERNWEKGQPFSRCLDSVKRHLNQYLGGDRSEDHLAAIRWGAGCLIH